MEAAEKRPTIVFIAGGLGSTEIEQCAVRSGLFVVGFAHPYDNGGHTGRLRQELGMPALGDLLQRIANHIIDDPIAEWFRYRWNGDHSLDGKRSMSEVMAGIVERRGNLSLALKEVESALASVYRGRVITISDSRDTHIRAYFDDGTTIEGENLIDLRGVAEPRIVNIDLNPKPEPTQEALRWIEDADLIGIGSGDWWTSIMPSLKTPGISQAIKKSTAPIFWFPNLATKLGETDGYQVSDFARQLVNQIGRPIDYALIDYPERNFPDNYRAEGSEPVVYVPDDCIPFIKFPLTGRISREEEIILLKKGVLTTRKVIRTDGRAANLLLRRVIETSRVKFSILTSL